MFLLIKQGNLLAVLKNKIRPKRQERIIQNKIINAISLNNKSALNNVESILRNYYYSVVFKKKGLPRSYINRLARLIYSNSSNTGIPISNYCDLLQLTENISEQVLPTDKWKGLSYISTCNGLFKLSLIFRNKAIDRAFANSTAKNNTVKGLLELLKAHLDQGEQLEAEEIMSRLYGKIKNKSYLDKLAAYISLMKGDKNNAWKIAKPYFSGKDLAFEEYVKGKKVAIVGPAPSGEELGSEIDSYDIVIRTNFMGKESMPLAKEFGTKTNISYYGGIIGKINEMPDHSFINEIDYAVYKRLRYQFQQDYNKLTQSRAMFNQDDLLFIGTANMIPLILYDIFHFMPSKVKVFKVNFHFTNKYYYDGYVLNKSKIFEPAEQWYSFANHDQITQLNFVRNLWDSMLIEVDKQCENVLLLSPEQYAADLERVYVQDASNSFEF